MLTPTKANTSVYEASVGATRAQTLAASTDVTFEVRASDTLFTADADNATLACEVETADQHFPMLISTKRIAPGEGNTWFLKVHRTRVLPSRL